MKNSGCFEVELPLINATAAGTRLDYSLLLLLLLLLLWLLHLRVLFVFLLMFVCCVAVLVFVLHFVFVSLSCCVVLCRRSIASVVISSHHSPSLTFDFMVCVHSLYQLHSNHHPPILTHHH
jgi:hypothetical protein